jgi:hypothetical protein
MVCFLFGAFADADGFCLFFPHFSAFFPLAGPFYRVIATGRSPGGLRWQRQKQKTENRKQKAESRKRIVG